MLKPTGPGEREGGRWGRRLTVGALLLLILGFGVAAGLIVRALHTTGLRFGRTLVLGPAYSGKLQVTPSVEFSIVPGTVKGEATLSSGLLDATKRTFILEISPELHTVNFGDEAGVHVRRQWGFYIVAVK